MLICFFVLILFRHERHIWHLRWRTSSRNQLCGVFYANAGGYSSCMLHSHGHSINWNKGSKLCLLWLDLCCLCVQSQISSFLHLAYRGKPKRGTHLHIYIHSPNISNQTNVIAFSLNLIPAALHGSVFRKLEKVEQLLFCRSEHVCQNIFKRADHSHKETCTCSSFVQALVICMPRLVLKESVQEEVMGFQVCVTVSMCCR